MRRGVSTAAVPEKRERDRTQCKRKKDAHRTAQCRGHEETLRKEGVLFCSEYFYKRGRGNFKSKVGAGQGKVPSGSQLEQK